MLRIFLICALTIGTAAAEAAIPKGATEVEPGVFKHKDASGKSYVYRKTPFGVIKSLEGATPSEKQGDKRVEAAASVPPKSDNATAQATPFGDLKKQTHAEIRVVEKGDTLEFERTSPFGGIRWKNKKDQLTPEEREAWQRVRSGAATASQTAGSQAQ
jgi:hypothetical protein